VRDALSGERGADRVGERLRVDHGDGHSSFSAIEFMAFSKRGSSAPAPGPVAVRRRVVAAATELQQVAQPPPLLALVVADLRGDPSSASSSCRS
jgi:hypothetical protein